MRPENQSKELFRGVLILTVAALITKILSAIYRIPFQNIVGDVGFYIYQQVYPFYGLAIVLATTGFPVVISKLYAEYKEKGDREGGRYFLLTAYLFLQVIGIFCFVLLYSGADEIAQVMRDSSLAILLKVVSIVFLTFPIIAVMRGFFQGNGNMIPTAVSQVVEQAIRVGTILLLAFLFTNAGYSQYYVGAGAMFGSITGAIVSVIILFSYLWIQLRKNKRIIKLDWKKAFLNAKAIMKALSIQGLSICVTGSLLIFIQLADSLNLYSLLSADGLELETAKALKGVYDRGQPLIQLGTVVATSISLTLVPLITAEKMRQDTDFLFHKVRLAVKINIVIGVAATTGLWCIIEPTNIMLFKNSTGSEVLGLLSLIILLNSLLAVIIAILQGLGIMMFPALIIFCSFLLKYALNFVLVPTYGTTGAAFATIIAITVAIITLRIRLKKVVTHKLVDFTFLSAVGLATVAMILILKSYLYGTSRFFGLFDEPRIGSGVQALSAVLLGGSIYLVLIIRQSVFTASELTLFPFGSKLMKLLANDEGRKK